MAHVNRPTHQRLRSGRTLLAGLSIALLITACGSGSDTASLSAPAATEAPAAVDEPAAWAAGDIVTGGDGVDIAPGAEAAPSGGGGGGGGGGAVGMAPDAAAGQLLAVDVTVNMEVDDVGVGVDEVVAVAARHDGQVYGSDISLAAGDSAFAHIVIKLPPGKIAGAIADIKLLGKHQSQTQATENVTDQMVDIETRIGTAQRSVDRVQLLLAEAENLGQVVQLEAELTSRQTVLEQMLAQQRNLGQRAALATLTVNLSGPRTVADTGPSIGDDSIGDSFRKGGTAFVATLAALLIVIGYTAPFLAVIAMAGAVWYVSRRRRARQNRSAAPLLPPVPAADQQTTERDSVDATRT